MTVAQHTAPAMLEAPVAEDPVLVAPVALGQDRSSATRSRKPYTSTGSRPRKRGVNRWSRTRQGRNGRRSRAERPSAGTTGPAVVPAERGGAHRSGAPRRLAPARAPPHDHLAPMASFPGWPATGPPALGWPGRAPARRTMVGVDSGTGRGRAGTAPDRRRQADRRAGDGPASADAGRRTWPRPPLRTAGHRCVRPCWRAAFSPWSRRRRTGPGPPAGRSLRHPTAAGRAVEW